MRIGIIGTNHQIAGIKYREKLAKIFHSYFTSNRHHPSKNGYLLLSTCNRTEVYYTSDDLATTNQSLIRMLCEELGDEKKYLFRGLYSYMGRDCFKHLSRVTAGLDSSIIAETEIQGQVKAAYDSFSKLGYLTSEMHYLFQRSLKIGKHIRSNVFHNQSLPKIEHAIHNTVAQHCENPQKQRLLFVGASDINRKILSYLRLKKYDNISICNRSTDSAKYFANKFGISFFPWDYLHRWHEYDVIIFGTKSQNYLIHSSDQNDHLAKKNRLVIDLCIPRNVDPVIGAHPQIQLMDIDQLNASLKVREKQMLELVEMAENIVTDSTLREMELFEKKRLRALLYADRLANY
jgi:glutamyl-tRNA reductase